jgi:hypothetical protein
MFFSLQFNLRKAVPYFLVLGSWIQYQLVVLFVGLDATTGRTVFIDIIEV